MDLGRLGDLVPTFVLPRHALPLGGEELWNHARCGGGAGVGGTGVFSVSRRFADVDWIPKDLLQAYLYQNWSGGRNSGGGYAHSTLLVPGGLGELAYARQPLVDRIRSELHGSNQTLALELLKGERNESSRVNESLAVKQAEKLHKAASGWGSADDSTFIQILAKNSPAQNHAIRDAYEKKYNRSLESLTNKVGNKNMQKCLQALLLPPGDYYAMRLRQSFVGLGTSDKVVCRILGGSDKPDALAIAAAYQRKYTTHLKDGIQKECSGKYKRLAQAWVTLPDALEDPDAPIVLPEENDDAEEAPPDAESEPSSPGTPKREPPPPPPPVPVYHQQAPPPGTFQVIVPANAGPGSQLIVQAPTGQQMTVIVPQGVGPGMPFAVPMPQTYAQPAPAPPPSQKKDDDDPVKQLMNIAKTFMK